MPTLRLGRRRKWPATRSGRIASMPSRGLLTEFVALAGDRKFGEDAAIVGGFGRFRGEAVCVIGHEKGSDTESRLKHNFGMARPEGYRKAVRLMTMADRFGIPVITLVDTAGAYPGIGAEERGQAEAIARSTDTCLSIGVPNIAVILGEGGSGGAIALATANRVLMLEHAIYSVISPEGAASILWRDTTKAQEAATNMKITAQDMVRFGMIDAIMPEPVGGAHRDPAAAIAATGEAIGKALGRIAPARCRRRARPAAGKIPAYGPHTEPEIGLRRRPHFAIYLCFTIHLAVACGPAGLPCGCHNLWITIG